VRSARGLLPHLLAALVAAHIVTACITGVGKAPPILVEAAPEASELWNRFRLDTRSAIRPYNRTFGTFQHWPMFGGTHKSATRVEIAIQIDGKWGDVYVEGTNGEWMRTLDHYRFRQHRRKLKTRKKDGLWRRFVGWVGAAAFAEFPDAEAVRVRAVWGRIPPPDARGPDARVRFRKVRKVTVVPRPE
jgi:hypothetical protein